jgi:hypothetical protein
MDSVGGGLLAGLDDGGAETMKRSNKTSRLDKSFFPGIRHRQETMGRSFLLLAQNTV